MSEKNSLPKQVVANMWLFYVAYELSKRGWNVLTTARNAKGIDIVIYSQDATRTHTIQVKALTKRSTINLGNNLATLIAEYIVICRGVSNQQPEVFIAKPSEIRHNICENEKNGKKSFWLQPKDYEDLKGGWEKIGSG